MFYNDGWNAYINNKPYDSKKSVGWRRGWNDCKKAKPEDRKIKE